MARDRQNVFTRHPEGTKILDKLLNKEIKQVEAARILGCTPANISTYLKVRNLRPTLEQRRIKEAPAASELALDRLKQLGTQTYEIDGKTPNELTAAVGWRVVMQGLLMMSERDLDVSEYVKISQAIIRMSQFEFKNRVPDIPTELLKLDPETEDRIIQRLGEFCELCPYLRAFNERKAIQQDKHRMEPAKSPSLGG